MITRVVTLTFLILMFSSVSFGLYFIVDYFMDHGIPKAFGQACDDYIHDDCLYINSHINTFGDFDYRPWVRCKMTLDAGSKPGATYKLRWDRFKVEATDCANGTDFLEFYDMSLHWHKRLKKRNTFMDRFCGWTYPLPNLTDGLTQQYFTFYWETNGERQDKGWRVLATRVWPEAYCPGDDYFRCKAENICMDARLKCDGIAQCDDLSDEAECQWWEKMIGGFLAIGTAGVTAISIIATFFYICLYIGLRKLRRYLRKRKTDVVQVNILAGSDPKGKGGDPATLTEEKEKQEKGKANKGGEKDKQILGPAVAPKTTTLGVAGATGAKAAGNTQLPNAPTKEPEKTTKAGRPGSGSTMVTGLGGVTGAPGGPDADKTGANTDAAPGGPDSNASTLVAPAPSKEDKVGKLPPLPK